MGVGLGIRNTVFLPAAIDIADKNFNVDIMKPIV